MPVNRQCLEMRKVQLWLRFAGETDCAAQFLPVRADTCEYPAVSHSSESVGVGDAPYPYDDARSIDIDTMKGSVALPLGGSGAARDDGLGSGGIPTNVGKVASALLAKHVRTLEVLHSLQMDNAKLRRDAQVRKSASKLARGVMPALSVCLILGIGPV